MAELLELLITPMEHLMQFFDAFSSIPVSNENYRTLSDLISGKKKQNSWPRQQSSNELAAVVKIC